jgi:hypothetical protein
MKVFGTGDTPFQPANPALDIPNGDPRENTTVTNQALNNPYAEIKNAIEQGGLLLTNANGTNADTKQLAKSIALVNLNGATFIDAGGSTATVRNLKPLNPNLILPTNSASWVGANVYLALPISGTATVDITVKIYDNTNTLILTSVINGSKNVAGAADNYLNCIYGSNNKFNAVRCASQYVKQTTGNFVWIYDISKPVGERDFTLTGTGASVNSSLSTYFDVFLPFTATKINSSTGSPIVGGSGSNPSGFYLVFADFPSYSLSKIGVFAINTAGNRLANFDFNFTITGTF